jgi:uncharacterized integral membrane protein (TIGR02327 family)
MSNAFQVAPWIPMVIVLASIYLSWWALQSLKFERFVRVPGSPQARMLHLLLAVILGHFFAEFVLSYFGWSS